MCGIAGIAGPGDPREDLATLERMLAAMVHRGPDEKGTHVEDQVAMGIRRLRIIDVATGQQPICNEDGSIWTVLNGEIYNYRELRAELISRGHVFKTQSDTEVLVHGYEEWKHSVLDRLNGMFGVAIWDRKERSLMLARDPYGIKPLYYAYQGARLFWSSEIKGLISASAVKPEVDSESLDLFLSFRFVPSPRTMFRRVERLAPGHRLIFDSKGSRIERYWKPTTAPLRLSEGDYVELLRERLQQAVQRQMVSDVPLGALLSGGIDSAAVVALMARASNQRVKTFTVGFKDHDDVSELEEARRTASLFDTEHHEVLVDSVDFRALLDRAVFHLEEPLATDSCIPMLLVCELARKHVTVVLTGQGADEPHGGYHRYIGERYGSAFRRLPTPLRAMAATFVNALPRHTRLKRAVRSLGIVDESKRFAAIYSVFDDRTRTGLWRTGQKRSTTTPEDIVRYWRDGLSTATDTVAQLGYIDARLSLSDDLLLYGDKMSMASSVEARVPFLDVDYMEVAESLPANMRIRGFNRKYIHKKALAKWLPEWLINRKKRGFESPVSTWFRSDLSGYVRERLLDPAAGTLAFFNRSGLEQLLSDHMSKRQDNTRQLFALLCFEVWYGQFIRRH